MRPSLVLRLDDGFAQRNAFYFFIKFYDIDCHVSFISRIFRDQFASKNVGRTDTLTQFLNLTLEKFFRRVSPLSQDFIQPSFTFRV